MKALVAGVAERYPEVRKSILPALTSVQPRFLMDRTLARLRAGGGPPCAP